MFELKNRVIIGMDPSRKFRDPTGLAVWEDKAITSCLTYTDEEILEIIIHNKTALVTIEASLSLPKGEFSEEQRKE